MFYGIPRGDKKIDLKGVLVYFSALFDLRPILILHRNPAGVPEEI